MQMLLPLTTAYGVLKPYEVQGNGLAILLTTAYGVLKQSSTRRSNIRTMPLTTAYGVLKHVPIALAALPPPTNYRLWRIET